MSRKQLLRATVVVGALGLAALCDAGVASAHVTANVYGNQPQKGGSGTIVFRVPNEESDAGTVKVEVDFKPEYAISSVRYRPVPGWTAEVTNTALPAPVKNGKNLDVTQAVTKVVWTAQPGGGIAKGADQFQEFEITASTLPSNVDSLALPAVQTYDNNKVVQWSDVAAPGAPEPEHPAPTVRLVAASAGDDHGMATMGTQDTSVAPAGKTSDDTARWLGGAGLAAGALGVGFGLGALTRSRKGTKS
ncbi:YcnI family copper-binding membrane protein [Amycolatopsis pigmentata]|uniref:YcnI family protein n=1 Tax=Amycolatopsis pigmentata TaxID=450801 RepID=A0ABW5FWA4_9PSEU